MYSLSDFSTEFLGDPHNPRPVETPTTLADAIASLPAETLAEIAAECFDGLPAEYIDVADIWQLAVDTNTVANIDSPVEVYIDPECKFSVLVYE